MNIRQLAVAVLALAIPASAHAAANLVQNGSFENVTTPTSTGNRNFQFSGNYGYGSVDNWTITNSTTNTNPFALLFHSNNVAPSNAASPSQAANYAINQYNDAGNYLSSGYAGASPDGGNFIALDGDPAVNAVLSQTINGLSAGTNYAVSFNWAGTELANRTGPTTEQLLVSFGSVTQATNVVATPTSGFSGWFTQTFIFRATSASQVLSFLSVGTPNGYPPVALLDGVSVYAAPEPSSLALIAVGMAGIVLAMRRRRGPRMA